MLAKIFKSKYLVAKSGTLLRWIGISLLRHFGQQKRPPSSDPPNMLGIYIKRGKIKYESPIIWAIASSLVEYLKYLASENGEITKVFLNLNFFDGRKKAAGGVNT